jgi:hypothetical protein
MKRNQLPCALLALLLLALGHLAFAQQLPQDRSAADVSSRCRTLKMVNAWLPGWGPYFMHFNIGAT